MTCIVALKTEEGIWVGGDSAGTNLEYGGTQTLRADLKVFKNGPMTFGFCGSFRMGQLLRYRLQIPAQPHGMDDYQYMVTTFIDEVRKVLKEGGYTYIAKNVETGGEFVVIYKDTIYLIEEDFQVGVSSNNYVAIGSGMDLALGALYVLDHSDPQKVIKEALKAAAEFNAYVAAPFHVMKHKP